MFKYYVNNWRSTCFFRHYNFNSIMYKIHLLLKREHRAAHYLRKRKVVANFLVFTIIPILKKIDRWARIERSMDIDRN